MTCDHVDVAVHAARTRRLPSRQRWSTNVRPILTNSRGDSARFDWPAARRLVAEGHAVACDECSEVFSQRVLHTLERDADLTKLIPQLMEGTP